MTVAVVDIHIEVGMEGEDWDVAASRLFRVDLDALRQMRFPNIGAVRAARDAMEGVETALGHALVALTEPKS